MKNEITKCIQINNNNKTFPYGVEWVYMSQGLLKSEYMGFTTPQEARNFINENKSLNFVKQ
tara:strand:- start:536 stop:718 length:183 start_codon:yes stop_codon:yes gene_type:complete